LIEEIHEPKGTTVLGDFKNCRNLRDIELLQKTCNKAIEIAGAHIEESTTVKFPGGGVSLNISLSESHLNLHTWPEAEICYVDFFTCGANCHPRKGMDFIKEVLCAEGSIRVIERNVNREGSRETLIDSLTAGELSD